MTDGKVDDDTDQKVDFFRDTHVRYLGYANEVGEAFRAHMHVNWVRATYGIACMYALADARHKGKEASEKTWKTPEECNSQIKWAVLDTIVWQGLASVIIPGFTINRVCALTRYLMSKSVMFKKVKVHHQRTFTTIIGLSYIPVIIKPIDKSVDFLMESTLRKWYHITPEMENIVHHDRIEDFKP